MTKRLLAGVALAGSVLVLLAAPALAHVTIDPTEAPRGSFAKLTFSVPNEIATANTVKFAVQFDENHPIATVDVKPKAGWTPAVIKKKLQAPLLTVDGEVTEAVSEVSWSGGPIGPGQFDEFEISVGPLPNDADLLVFPAVQTYSDGTEVSWIQQSFAGQPEPEHPAPQLALTATASRTRNVSSSTTSTTKTVAIAAFLIGSAGLVIGSWAWWNVRRWR